MVKLIETSVIEYSVRFLIGMHCKQCGCQIGFFNDVTKNNTVWTIEKKNLMRVEHVAQFVCCANCPAIVAEWARVEDKYWLDRTTLKLQHFS